MMMMQSSQDMFWIDQAKRKDDFYTNYVVDDVMGKYVRHVLYYIWPFEVWNKKFWKNGLCNVTSIC